jgi:hypothetical protein
LVDEHCLSFERHPGQRRCSAPIITAGFWFVQRHLFCSVTRARRSQEASRMFEDETIRIACPRCGFKNQFLVREFEGVSEMRVPCEGCKVALKIQAQGFRERLDRIEAELEAMRLSTEERRRKTVPSRAIDFQI